MVIVSLLEEMPVRETLELHAQATSTLQMPLGPLMVNRVWPRDLDAESESSWAQHELNGSLDPAQAEGIALLDSSLGRGQWQREHLETLRSAIPGNLVLLPELPRGTFDRDSIATLADRIEHGLAHAT